MNQHDREVTKEAMICLNDITEGRTEDLQKELSSLPWDQRIEVARKMEQINKDNAGLNIIPAFQIETFKDANGREHLKSIRSSVPRALGNPLETVYTLPEWVRNAAGPAQTDMDLGNMDKTYDQNRQTNPGFHPEHKMKRLP